MTDSSDQGVATSLRLMLEEHFYFLMASESYIFEEGRHLFTHYPPTILRSSMPKWLFQSLIKWQGNKVCKS